MTVRCCKCNRAREASGWIARAQQPQESVSHTYCPECLQATRREIQEEQREVSAAPVRPIFGIG